MFFAIWPPRKTADALHAWALAAQRACGGRVTHADAVHLTLAFLGEVDEKRLESLKGIAAKGERHLLPTEQAGYWAHNRIVWAGPHATPVPLANLVDDLRKSLVEMQFESERRAFSAHVTLIRKARAAGELPRLPAVAWPVEEFVLVRSRLEAQGPRYEVVERFPLS